MYFLSSSSKRPHSRAGSDSMLSQSITVQVPSVCGGTITASTRPSESQTNTRLIASPLVGLNWDDCWDELKGLLGAEMWVKRRLIKCETTMLHAQLCIPSIRGGGIELKAALKMRKLLILLKEKCATRR